MRTALILHGTPEREEYFNPDLPATSNSHWIPWLQKQLLIEGIPTQTPEMPHAWNPQYPIWKKEFERYDLDESSILVGHSCGGGFLTRWLTEHPQVRVDKIVLVAPWVDPFRRKTTDFYDFEIDPSLANRANNLTIFHSDDDMEEVQESVRRLRRIISGAKYREFHKYGHFCFETMNTSAFPELLELVLSPVVSSSVT
jgi:predicted alpha/beta hydrolase family esterase